MVRGFPAARSAGAGPPLQVVMVLAQAGPGVQAVPLLPGKDVEVQSGHALLGGLPAGAEDIHPVIAAVLHIVLRETSRTSARQLQSDLLRAVVDGLHMDLEG